MHRRRFLASLFAAAVAPTAIARVITAPPASLTAVLVCDGGVGFGMGCHVWVGNPLWARPNLLAKPATDPSSLL